MPGMVPPVAVLDTSKFSVEAWRKKPPHELSMAKLPITTSPIVYWKLNPTPSTPYPPIVFLAVLDSTMLWSVSFRKNPSAWEYEAVLFAKVLPVARKSRILVVRMAETVNPIPAL